MRTHVNGSSHSPMSPTGYNDRYNSNSYSPNHYNHNNHSESPSYQYGRFDASALHIAHALKQTEIQKAYRMHREKPIDCYLVSAKKLIFSIYGPKS